MSPKLLATLLMLALHLHSPEAHWPLPQWRPSNPNLNPNPNTNPNINPNPIPNTNPNPIPNANALCENQFALVNRACLLVPTRTTRTQLPSHPLPGGGGGTEAITVHHRRHHHRGRGHGHGHGHGHEHRPLRQETPAEEECCRWLREVDSMCACDLLVRLPPFLVRPVHSYTVDVDDSCSVTFRCGARS